MPPEPKADEKQAADARARRDLDAVLARRRELLDEPQSTGRSAELAANAARVIELLHEMLCLQARGDDPAESAP